MLSLINRREFLNDTFNTYPEIDEVYSTKDFSMEKDTACFIIKVSNSFNLTRLLFDLQKPYSLPINLYVARNNHDSLLENKILIWYKGKWYV